MKHLLLVVLLVVFCWGCSNKRYGNYAYSKKTISSKYIKVEKHKAKPIIDNSYSLHQVYDTIVALPVEMVYEDVITYKKVSVTAPSEKETSFADTLIENTSNGKEVKVNTQAKIAFWSAVGVLTAVFASIAFSGFFVLLIPILSILCLVFGIIALKRIKKTGEYGKPKAEFALFIGIPFLLASLIFGLSLYIFLQNGAWFSLTF